MTSLSSRIMSILLFHARSFEDPTNLWIFLQTQSHFTKFDYRIKDTYLTSEDEIFSLITFLVVEEDVLVLSRMIFFKDKDEILATMIGNLPYCLQDTLTSLNECRLEMLLYTLGCLAL